ncbi:hypothetical protein [Promicromonospora soli]|uniref:Uncharacterized protein n=1 Tax=Promicromonospora soli TaxID=2035533 RepID=A0A919KTL6_9MICO|nr:hypothetical protein [Promicromonospora soli]GHH72655.1 hypothetical protein GCM10017772_22580 [Promicromonospora soli]
MNPRRTRTAPKRGRLAAPLLAAALLTACTAGPGQGPDDGPASEPGPSAVRTTPPAERGEAGSGTAGPDDADPGDADPDKAGPDKAGPDTAEPGTADPDTADPDAAGEPTPTPSGRSGGQSGGEGSEVAPAGSQDRSPGDSLGDTPVPSAGRLSTALRTGSAAGLVRGFPDDVVLVPAGAKVASSSVTGSDGRYQVTLDAAVDAACTDVLLDYRVWFTTGGFAETGTTTRPGRTTVELERNDGSVMLGTARSSAGCEVTVFATLSAR